MAEETGTQAEAEEAEVVSRIADRERGIGFESVCV